MNTLNQTKYKLLIVEDEEENQKFLLFLLSKLFETDICPNDVGFYEKIKSKDYNIFLVDIALKGSKNGLELIKELRQNEKYKNIPVVCLTAHAFNKDKENAMAAGADIYLTKPLPNQVLIDSLFNLLKVKSK
jgi:CheY-like chemotaxis protein